MSHVSSVTRTWRSSCQSRCQSAGRTCGCRWSPTGTACWREETRTTCPSHRAPAARPAQSAARRDDHRYTRNASRVRRRPHTHRWGLLVLSGLVESCNWTMFFNLFVFQRRAVLRARGWCVMTLFRHQELCRRLSSPRQSSERTDQQNTCQTRIQNRDQRMTTYTSECTHIVKIIKIQRDSLFRSGAEFLNLCRWRLSFWLTVSDAFLAMLGCPEQKGGALIATD